MAVADVFQHVQTIHVGHVQRGESQVGGHTVYHHERIAVVDGAQATDLDGYIIARTSGIHDLHAGNLSLNGLTQVGDWCITQFLVAQRGDRAGQVTLLHGAVAYYHYLIQHLGIFCQHHLQTGTPLDGHFLRLIAHVGEHQRGLRGDLQAEVAVDTRNDSVRRAFLHHAGADDGLTDFVFYYTLHCDLLREDLRRAQNPGQ